MSTDQPPVPQQPHPMFPPPHPADSTPPPNPGVFSAPPTSGGYAAGPSHPAYPGYPAAPPSQAWAPTFPLASWGDRVVAALIDTLYLLPFSIAYVAGIMMAAINAPTKTRSVTVVSPGNSGAMWPVVSYSENISPITRARLSDQSGSARPKVDCSFAVSRTE